MPRTRTTTTVITTEPMYGSSDELSIEIENAYQEVFAELANPEINPEVNPLATTTVETFLTSTLLFQNGSQKFDPFPLEHPIVYPRAAVLLALCFSILFIVMGAFGNAVTVAALLKSRKLRGTVTSVFIVSLCCTDLIFCVFNLPITAVRYANQRWILGEKLCQMFPFFFYLNVAASLFNMMTITINRYILIAHYPSYENIYKRSSVIIMICLCWMIPLSLLVPTTFESWGRFGYDPHTFSCTILSQNGKSPKKLLFLIGFFLPCLVTILCYIRIYILVRRSRRNLSYHCKNGSEQTKFDKRQVVDEMNLTKIIITIFLLFLCCYLPLMVVNVFDDDHSVPTIHVLASISAWSASVVNPIVYAAMNARYRKAYVSLLPTFCRNRIRRAGTSCQQLSTTGSGGGVSGVSSATTQAILEAPVVYTVKLGNNEENAMEESNGNCTQNGANLKFATKI